MKKDRYHRYLNSQEWDDIRKKVIIRANGHCEGCGIAAPLDVHHLTYDRVGMELMTDLVALCRDCHDKAHNKNDATIWHQYIAGNANYYPGVLDNINMEVFRHDENVIRTDDYIVVEYESRNNRISVFAKHLVKNGFVDFIAYDKKGAIYLYPKIIMSKYILKFGSRYTHTYPDGEDSVPIDYFDYTLKMLELSIPL